MSDFDLPNYLPGIPPMYGVKASTPVFSQGQDVLVEFPIVQPGPGVYQIGVSVQANTSDIPQIPALQGVGLGQLYFGDSFLSSWNATITVKKDLEATNVLWTGTLNNGVYYVKNNIYLLYIPATVTATFRPGTYYYCLSGHMSPTNPAITTPLNVTFANGVFSINLNPASPNPNGNYGDTENTEPGTEGNIPDFVSYDDFPELP